MSYLYRCKRRIKGEQCDTRRALPRKVEMYVRKPKCKVCGNELTYIDEYQRKRDKKNTCICDGLHYPHRKGTKWCNYYDGEYTEDDMRERHCG